MQSHCSVSKIEEKVRFYAEIRRVVSLDADSIGQRTRNCFVWEAIELLDAYLDVDN